MTLKAKLLKKGQPNKAFFDDFSLSYNIQFYKSLFCFLNVKLFYLLYKFEWSNYHERIKNKSSKNNIYSPFSVLVRDCPLFRSFQSVTKQSFGSHSLSLGLKFF